jgi:DNA-binding LacI/PurR family transcriptional regulator
VATIAELAGVSAPTVSKVLNGREGVGRDTRERVEALLRDHGYRKPGQQRTTPCLEVVFYAILAPIAVDILRGVEEVAGPRNLVVGFTDVYRRTELGLPWVESLLARRPIGVIEVFSGLTAEYREHLEASGLPLVALDPTGDLYPIPSVGSTNWNGGLAAARHLLELGHRRIGVITGPMNDLSSRARLDGVRAALDGAGVPFDRRLMRHGLFTVDDGRDLGLDLLRPAGRPTAVVCGDDLQALGVYQAARIAGLHIPGDLSVVGFDDVSHSHWCNPPMTTIRQPFTEMGAAAARMVLDLAEGRKPAQSRVELGTALVVRESTAPPC